MQRESIMDRSEAFPRSPHSYWIKWVKTNLIFCKCETQLLNAELILLRWCGRICRSSLTVLELLVHFHLLCALPGCICNHVRTITFGLTANKSAKTSTGLGKSTQTHAAKILRNVAILTLTRSKQYDNPPCVFICFSSFRYKDCRLQGQIQRASLMIAGLSEF